MAQVDTLFHDNDHEVLRFADLVVGEGVQANQFCIRHGDRAALIDPGGDLTYTPLTIALSRRVNLNGLDYILASHQDPDIIASLPRWLMHTRCQVVVSRLWSRFLPHLASSYVTGKMGEQLQSRILGIGDEGRVLPFAGTELWILPAHFLHSVGNFSFYDPVSGILFSGDVGASLGGEEGEVRNFADHLHSMVGFHRRYMASNRACRLWVAMVRDLAPRMIVPQHGGYFVGDQVARFLNWLAALECGVDLLDSSNFRLPPRDWGM
ncbi:MAG: MBL fold metallo-hydrolase [Pseudomonadales bacterium]|nr:MBL fold metallo-hydrolase [Pseudomonadales bacterium]